MAPGLIHQTHVALDATLAPGLCERTFAQVTDQQDAGFLSM